MDAGRVLVAGASGGTGQEVLRVLGATDHTVRATTRSPEAVLALEAVADEVVVGDLLDRSDAARVVEDVDVVISTVGSSPRRVLSGYLRDRRFVDGEGTVNLVDAAERADVRTFVMESSLGVGEDRGSWMARGFRMAIKPVLAAKAAGEAAVRDSGLRYTILRPGVLTNGPVTRDVPIAPAGTGLWGFVSRADVAELLVASVATESAANRTLEVARHPLGGDGTLDVDWTWA